jgi:hypothetical protein
MTGGRLEAIAQREGRTTGAASLEERRVLSSTQHLRRQDPDSTRPLVLLGWSPGVGEQGDESYLSLSWFLITLTLLQELKSTSKKSELEQG